MISTAASGYRAGLRSSVAAAASADYVTEISYTEYASAGCTLGIAADGTLFVAPAFTTDGVGVLRSTDAGATWRALVPNGLRHRRIAPYLYFDDVDDRLYFHTGRFGVMPPLLRRSGFDSSVSDDRGGTWTGRPVARKARDWAKVFAGPRVASAGSGRVTYLSAPTPFSTRIAGVVRAERQVIWRSYDGGVRWEIAGGFDIDPLEIPGLPDTDLVVFGKGVVAPDGTVYLGGRYGTRFAVAISRDEGATWDIRIVPGSSLARYHNVLHFVLLQSQFLLPEPIAVDDDGTLYVLWPDPRGILHASWSSDGGLTWSRPVVVTSPSVRSARFGAITATGSGRVGIAYYGRGRGRAFHGYLAQTRDFRTATPVFVGGPFNDEDAPLYPYGFDPGYLSTVFGGNLNEIIRVQFAPNGDLVVSAAMQMRGRNRGRPWAVRSKRGALQAVVGRLGRRGAG